MTQDIVKDLWAVVAWAGDDGVLIAGDPKTRELVADHGCSDHWGDPPGGGAWRWDGSLRWIDDGEDFLLSGEWRRLWAPSPGDISPCGGKRDGR